MGGLAELLTRKHATLAKIVLPLGKSLSVTLVDKTYICRTGKWQGSEGIKVSSCEPAGGGTCMCILSLHCLQVSLVDFSTPWKLVNMLSLAADMVHPES